MTLRWGIVTAAKICNDFVNAFNSFPDKGDQAIVAVAARDIEKARAFANTHKIPKVFESYEAMAKSKDIDVAYIGSLTPDHYRLTYLYLQNGKHVLCEKPLCLNYKQVESLVNLARSKKLFLMEAVWSRFSPSYRALEEEINAGKLGDVKFVEATYGVPIKDIPRIGEKNLGGSALLDIGIYTLQFAQYIFKDEPKKVTAIGELNEDGVDVVDTVVLEYDNDKLAVLHINVKHKLWNKATVIGTKSRATVEDPFHFPEVLIRSNGKAETFSLHKSKLPYNFDNSAGLVYQALEVARCIKNGLIESPRMTHRDSLILAKIETTIRNQIGVHYDVDDQEFP